MSDIIPITRPSAGMQQQPKTDSTPKYPTETISLPSQGLLYDTSNPLSVGTLEMKNLTAREENLLTNQTLIKNGTLLDKLLESVIVDKTIKIDDLLMTDFDAAIFALRQLAYGTTYDAVVTCGRCGKENQVEIDLSILKNKDLDLSLYPKGENNFSFQLPNSKTNITFKFLTRKDIYNIDKEIESLKKISKQSTEMTTRLNYIITSVDGDNTTARIRKFVDGELLSKDSLELRRHIKQISPELNSTFEFCCSECEYRKEEQIPMGITFLFPN